MDTIEKNSFSQIIFWQCDPHTHTHISIQFLNSKKMSLTILRRFCNRTGFRFTIFAWDVSRSVTITLAQIFKQLPVPVCAGHEPSPPLHFSRVETPQGTGQLLQAAFHVTAVIPVTAVVHVVIVVVVSVSGAAAAAVHMAAGSTSRHQARIRSYQYRKSICDIKWTLGANKFYLYTKK
jgi:hypothetical protein